MLTDNRTAPLILIVEDNESHAELIQRSFEDVPEEYRMAFVGTIGDAKVATQRHAPSLVLTDFRLPDGEGISLVSEASGAWPVVLMTSHGNEQVAVDAMRAGALDYLVKTPESFAALPRIARRSLREWDLIQGRIRAEEKIHSAKKDWENTFDAVPDLIAIIDINHTITRVNKSMADRCGSVPEELIGRKCHEVMHGMYHPHAGCPHTEMIRDGSGHSVVVEEQLLNGIFDVTVSPLYTAGGELAACVHIARDITARVQAEEALRESEERHRKLVHEQQIILNTSSVGICFLKDRKVLWANPAFDMMFGYEAGATHAMDTAELYAESETYTSIGEEGYASIESGVVYSKDVMMKKRDGSRIWCNLVGQAVRPGDAAEGSIWGLLDITARKQAEEERHQMEQQFQQTQKLESLGVLAGGIAHDFNNILSIILGHCYILIEDIDSGIDRQTHVKRIESAAERAAALCRQMLSYAGKNALVQTRVNMWLMVDENVKMLRSAIKKNVGFELDLRYDTPEITGDAAQIQQVVMNLIINAAEAIGDKEGTINVALNKVIVAPGHGDHDYISTTIVPGSYVCLTVSDNGCGMDAETQKRVFEPFYTTKFTGRGLGMSAVLGIITSHKGFLQLSSAPDVGTTFTVYFPPADKSGAATVIPTSAAVPPAKTSGTILLVDDEEALRIIGSALLNAIGFSTMVAANGREALETYREQGAGIDLILLDLLMPGMGGIETYRMLRELSPELPVVICSGYSVDSILEDIDSDLHVAVLQKPYTPDQLRDTVIQLLSVSGQQT